MVKSLICLAFWSATLVRGRRLLKSSAYFNLSVNIVALIWDLALIRGNTVHEMIISYRLTYQHVMIIKVSAAKMVFMKASGNFQRSSKINTSYFSLSSFKLHTGSARFAGMKIFMLLVLTGLLEIWIISHFSKMT